MVIMDEFMQGFEQAKLAQIAQRTNTIVYVCPREDEGWRPRRIFLDYRHGRISFDQTEEERLYLARSNPACIDSRNTDHGAEYFIAYEAYGMKGGDVMRSHPMFVNLAACSHWRPVERNEGDVT